MKEELVKKALDYLNNIESFTAKNVPAYMEEVLNYSFYSELSDLVWVAPLLVVSVLMFFWSKTTENDDDKISCFILGLFFSGITLGTLSVHILDVVKVSVAPRMYLLEYFSEMVK